LLANLGAVGVFLVLFAETGLLIGFFLPGDSLLFTAGLLCTTGATATVQLSLPTVLMAAAAGALLGAQVGYVLGRRCSGPSHRGLQTGAVRPVEQRRADPGWVPRFPASTATCSLSSARSSSSP
jgi:membrane protein DedA with SNARE-associated domain